MLAGWAIAGWTGVAAATPEEEIAKARALDAQVEEAYAAGRYADAEQAARASLDVIRAAVGAEDPRVASALNNLAALVAVRGDHEAALPLYAQSLAIRRAALGPDHPDVAISLNNLASSHEKQGDYDTAKDLYTQSLAIRRAALGPRDPEVATAVSNLAVLLEKQGDTDTARRMHEEALDIRREALGPRHLMVAHSLGNLAVVFQAQGDLQAARPLMEESLAIRREAAGADHPDVAISLNNLAILSTKLGDYRQAAELLEESLAIRRAVFGPAHAQVALVLNNLATVHMELGDLDRAQEVLEEVLAIQRSSLGPTHPMVGHALGNLAFLLKLKGDYSAARAPQEESIRLKRALLGPRHGDVGKALSNLADLLVAEGDYAGARLVYDESLGIMREAFGPNDPRVARTTSSMATLLDVQGDHAEARPMHEWALAVARETDPDHPWVGAVLNELGAHHHRTGRSDLALPLFEESLAIARRTFSDGHPKVAVRLNNVAAARREMGDHAAALELFEEALRIRTAALGPDHPAVARGLGNLGVLAMTRGDPEEARRLFSEGLAGQRRTLGPDHPSVALTLRRLAAAHGALDDDVAARSLLSDALRIVEDRLDQLDALSEREALAYLPTVRPILDAWLVAHDGPDDARAAWTHSLRFKGAVVARQRTARAMAAVEPEAADLSAKRDAVRRRLAQIALAEPDPDGAAARGAELAELSAEAQAIERQLLQVSAAWRASRATAQADPAALCDALRRRTALVDLLRYERDETPHYLAFVLTPSDCAVRRVELGEAAPVEEAVAAWREALASDAVPARVDARGAAVTERVWAPLAPWLPARVLVVPDGPLAAAPLGALPLGEGRYLVEEVTFAYLDRAHELVELRPVGSGALVVGDVDFGAAGSRGAGGQRGRVTPCASRDWAPLPGTASEADALAARWRGSRDGELLRLAGAAATETAVLEAMAGRAIVHLGTHGFAAVSARCRSVLEGTGGVGYDPMLLSGIALAGANVAADAWAAEDGVLTAAEVASHDLTGTGLVVLSGCETGLGEAPAGQGVLGLRRGFAVAGASSLVMSLWSVGDAETSALMDGFYDNLLRRSRHPVEALRRAQLEALGAQRAAGPARPWAWAGFVASGVPW